MTTEKLLFFCLFGFFFLPPPIFTFPSTFLLFFSLPQKENIKPTGKNTHLRFFRGLLLLRKLDAPAVQQ